MLNTLLLASHLGSHLQAFLVRLGSHLLMGIISRWWLGGVSVHSKSSRFDLLAKVCLEDRPFQGEFYGLVA